MGPASERSDRLILCEPGAEEEGEHLPLRRRASECPVTPRVPWWGRRPLANSSSGRACRDHHGDVPGYEEEGLSLV